jgi:hypothetical protein
MAARETTGEGTRYFIGARVLAAAVAAGTLVLTAGAAGAARISRFGLKAT